MDLSSASWSTGVDEDADDDDTNASLNASFRSACAHALTAQVDSYVRGRHCCSTVVVRFTVSATTAGSTRTMGSRIVIDSS